MKILTIILLAFGVVSQAKASVNGYWQGTLTVVDQTGAMEQFDDCKIIVSQSEHQLSISDPAECTMFPSDTMILGKRGNVLHRLISGVDTDCGTFDETPLFQGSCRVS